MGNILTVGVGKVLVIYKSLRDSGHTVLLLHHTPRANERASKGSTAITDLADHVLALYRVRKDSYERIEDEHDPPPDALYRFGTGDKTRFMPAQVFIQRSPSGGYILAPDPDLEILDAITEYIKNAQVPLLQKDIAEWAKKELEIKQKARIVALLKKGESKRWRSKREGVRRFYEPL